ncbi:hypothetical protein [Flavobacterium sp.]|jgi:hypothetical protein|uniref:hypothetical protein n=1 Tax=Flavobacterium sp. TaxID=239 RepID=UPI0037C15AFB
MLKKIILLICFIITAQSIKAQTPCTLIFKNGISGEFGYKEGGIQVELPEDFTLYVFGDRIISNIEEFNSFEEFKNVEQEILIKNEKILFQKLCGNDTGCGDTNISYEIHNSEMFKYCRVIFYYYDSFMSTNSVIDGWFSLPDGNHTIIIKSNDTVFFQKNIRLNNGILIN